MNNQRRTINFLFLFHISSILCITLGHSSSAEAVETVGWYDGDRYRLVQPDPNHLIVDKRSASGEILSKNKLLSKLPPNSAMVSESNSYLIVDASNTTDTPNLGDETTTRSAYLAHQAPNSARYFPLNQVIVHLRKAHDISNVRIWAKQNGLGVSKFEGVPGTYLIDCGGERNCRNASTYLYSRDEVKYAYPAWVKQRSLRILGDDPLFPQQWHLHNTGQNGIFGEDIRAFESWAFTSEGANHIIGIVDEGMEIAHPDLIENATPGLHWDYVESDADPTAGRHGTAVAGIAGARGGNALGVSGTAPFTGIAGIRLLDLSGFVSDLDEANALNHQRNQIAIYNNSWGPLDNGNLDGPSPMTIAAIEEGTSKGRQGRGSIYVWAAGNGKQANDNANYDGYANQPYVIAVSATNSSGIQTYYSEPGANIWLNAPGGDTSGWISTTDSSGPSGYSGTDYITSFGGASASSPQVAGVIAMMLDQNPNLSWRDIKLILAQSATQNDPTDADWVQNGAGYWINHKYGFGRVDAYEAVTSAATHTQLPALLQFEKGLSPNLPIPDNNSMGITSEIALENNHEIEFVQVTVDSDHPYWGDLKIELISPAGTISTLSETHNSSGSQLSGGWAFGSARYLGEQSAGIWRLRIADGAELDMGTLNTWTIKIYGHSAQGQAVGATPIPSLGLTGLLVLSLTLIIVAITQGSKQFS